MSLTAIRANTDAGTAEQKRLLERKRNIIVLIHQHLIENGYIESAERLQKEAGIVCDRFEVADNLDLGLVLNEYESYYELKFNKKPKIVRKLRDGEEAAKPKRPPAKAKETKTDSNNGKTSKTSSGSGAAASMHYSGSGGGGPESQDPEGAGMAIGIPYIQARAGDSSGDLSGLSISGSNAATIGSAAQVRKSVNKKSCGEDDDVDMVENRLLRPLPHYGGDPEMKALCGVISREIYQESPDVSFADIIGLDDAKRLLAEAIQLPLKFPSLFTGILRPWRGILLHGPPGTGKTLLAKAVATECRTTFFNISASTLVSKWRGDSEKLVRVLFELARYHAPSTIFLDEMDSILSARGDGGGGGGGGEHESSRRMKTELLIQMDGLKGYKSSESVFVLAASNLPWDLDVAVLRRLEKRVLVTLPIAEARQDMMFKHLSSRCSEDANFQELSALTEGYSGADIELLCRESAMRPVRRLMSQLQSIPEHPLPMPAPPQGGAPANTAAATPASSSNNGSMAGSNSTSGNTTVKGVKLLKQAADDVEALLKSDPVTHDDILEAIKITKPSSDGRIAKYAAWQHEFGST